MTEKFDCFTLVRKKSRRRCGTAVLIFPGLVPTYEDTDHETKLFSKFGDVLDFHYPEDRMDIDEFYDRVTDVVKGLGYKKIILVGVSFGGTLAYLLIRYWRKHRLSEQVKCFVALSAPFEPENLTPLSQFQLDLGVTVDAYARKLFIGVVKILRWIWLAPFSPMALYVRDNTFRQTLNALWMGGDTLNKAWLVKRRLLRPEALLMNVEDGVSDRLVLRTNEGDFLDIFPKGKVMRCLKKHAHLGGASPAVYRQMARFVERALEA